jgi:hypothetical protein
VPNLEQPDLLLSPESPPRGRPAKVQGRREVWVRFQDGTLRSCKVTEWRGDSRGWWFLLRWGLSGRLAEGWFRYDRELVEPIGEAALPVQDDAAAPSD